MWSLLVTGFEAFPEVPTNPTERLVRTLPRHLGDAEVTAAVLPVDTEAIEGALRALAPERFDAVIHLGVAHTRSRVSLERRAVNRLFFTSPDNRGRKPAGRPIDPEGPGERRTRLPLPVLARAFAGAGLEVEESDDAGQYLCNQLMYLSLGMTRGPCGFVHVPPDEALAERLGPGAPRVPLARLERGLRDALGALAGRAESA